MKKLILAALVAASFAVHAEGCDDKFPYRSPQVAGDFAQFCRNGYAVIHDNAHKIPFVVYEHLTPDTIGHGNVERKNAFREDPSVPPYARSKPSDYRKAVGYDRGHLADAQNASDDKAMYDTFLLSNIVPQVSSFNRGQWKALETHIAKLVRKGRELYVVTGALPGTRTIGQGVGIPDAMFKIVVDKQNGEAIAYLMSNEVGNYSYRDRALTINDLTKAVGVDLVPDAPASLRNLQSPSLK